LPETSPLRPFLQLRAAAFFNVWTEGINTIDAMLRIVWYSELALRYKGYGLPEIALSRGIRKTATGFSGGF
jgi:hypothetical protein